MSAVLQSKYTGKGLPKQPFCSNPNCRFHAPKFMCTEKRKVWNVLSEYREVGPAKYKRVTRKCLNGDYYCSDCAYLILFIYDKNLRRQNEILRT